MPKFAMPSRRPKQRAAQERVPHRHEPRTADAARRDHRDDGGAEGELQAEQRECLAAAKDSAESLLALIDNVLELSSIEAGKLSLAAAAFNLRQSLDDALRALALQARQRDLQFGQVDPGVPRLVTGDWNRLRQIVASLVGNAVKFTDRGDVSLEVSQDAIIDRLVFLHFVVRDTGIGIPQEKQAAIFGMFEQADRRWPGVMAGPDWGWPLPRGWPLSWTAGCGWKVRSSRQPLPLHSTARLAAAGQVAAEEPATRTPCGAPCTQGTGAAGLDGRTTVSSKTGRSFFAGK